MTDPSKNPLMSSGSLEELLTSVRDGEMDVGQALERLRHFPVMEMGHTTLDTHRKIRTGVAEIIYCAGKTTGQVIDIIASMRSAGQNVLGTRVPPEMAEALVQRFEGLEHSALARTIFLQQHEIEMREGKVLIVCAGTSDLPVAEEAAVTLRALGNPVERATDVGVAGIHRLIAKSEQLAEARVIIVVAGMEGALPSVVAGLVSSPVIAVPTSVGYGASLGGIAALLAMLNSCAGGIGVVNIDNGVGAAVLANAINAL